MRMPHWPLPLFHKEINYELLKTIALLEAVGSPHLKLPPVIHVAGTNGKGSTLAFMRSILESQGLKVHCYTSPHLVRFNERIVVSGNEISDEMAFHYLERTRIAAQEKQIEVTFFEGVTAAAFLAFAENKADIALIEVGLGGRLDSTNVIKPEVTVITPISLDHTQFLGEKIFQIALEKAGIMKANCPCISSLQSQEAFDVIEFKANELGIETYVYDYDFTAVKNEGGFSFKSKIRDIELPKPNLIGDHQYVNAATAIEALLNLKSFIISDEAIKKGVATAKWPARLQQITNGKLRKSMPDNVEIWIDGAHNEAGAEVLSLWLGDQQNEDIFLVTGLTKGRNINSFLRHFIGKVKFVAGMLVEGEPSSYKAHQISDEALSLGFNSLPLSSFEEVANYVTANSNGKKCKLLICGSLYLAGDALSFNAASY